MSYAELYRACQNLNPPLSRRFVLAKVKELTGIESLRIIMSGLDPTVTRGFYLSAKNREHRLVQQTGSHVVVVARDMPEVWQRFVSIKEMMHVFDTPEERTNSGEKFDRLLSEWAGAGAVEQSAQLTAEVKCMWRALALYCPEEYRAELEADRANGQTDDYEISLMLRLPEEYVRNLFRDDYADAIRILCEQIA